ncbi:conserved phage C-terminal domain-containing protein [Neobacillus pocheonensis]|uniref:conserved phage C-terminal domain-containing protein n=1 Tax=Neobacillus pocheonensis TaxID=363869 RepID=UPI003D28DCFE
MSKLLINEHPIMIIPSLAMKIGLYEAAVLQQMHYWVTSSKHEIGGRKWIFNTYKDWHHQFPFWSESTIKRAIRSLENQGLLLSDNFNRLKLDKTKWYTIDYGKVGVLENHPAGLADLSSHADSPIEASSENKAIPETTSENTTEKKLPIPEVIHYLNEKTKAEYKPGTNKTQELIRARVREGFTLEDFKKVIDLKTAEWLHDPRMCKFLRPATLFGTKFESYLNQKSSKKTLSEEDFDLHD